MSFKTPLKVMFCLSLLIPGVRAGGQQPDTTVSAVERYASLIRALRDFSDNIPQEKVYLHFDNTSYYAGDHIWFKCYVVSPGDNQPRSLSKTLYVELLSPGGEVVDKRTLRIENGQCHGEFRLNHVPFYSGFYEVRAYTRYMLNFGDEVIFSRLLPVYDRPQVSGDFTEKNMLAYDRWGAVDDKFGTSGYIMRREGPRKGDAVNVRFFPEGGHLVQGVPSRIAFEATDRLGNPMDVTGNLEGETSHTFTSSHEGRGVFTYTPGAGDKRIEVIHSGRRYRFDLPKAEPRGIVMQVDNLSQPDSIAITIRKSAETPDGTLGLALLCAGRLNSCHIVDAGGDEVSIDIDKTSLPAGVAQIVLFDEAGRIVCDRLVFIPPREGDKVDIEMAASKPFYMPFEQIELDFSLSDATGSPVGTPFSLAVRDADNELEARGNILTDLLLTSDIKGYVRDPMYYFEGDDPARRTALDQLLMVQAWRRYSWDQMTGLAPLNHEYLPEQGIEVHGTVVTEGLLSDKEVPAPGTQVSLLMTPRDSKEKATPGADSLAIDSLATDSLATDIASEAVDAYTVLGYVDTDSLGRFDFTSNAVGKWNLLFGVTKPGGKRQKNYRVMLDRIFSPVPRAYRYVDLQTDNATAVEADEVTVTEADAKAGAERWTVEEVLDDDALYEKYLREYLDSVKMPRSLLETQHIDPIVVRAKTYEEWLIEDAQQTSMASFDGKQKVDELYDNGEFYQDINSLIASLDRENFRIKNHLGTDYLLYKNGDIVDSEEKIDFKLPLVVVN